VALQKCNDPPLDGAEKLAGQARSHSLGRSGIWRISCCWSPARVRSWTPLIHLRTRPCS